MFENKGTAMLIVVLVVATGGLALGGYSLMQIETGAAKGESGNDGDGGAIGVIGPIGPIGPGYFCSSGSEVQTAIDTIGSGTGKIIITNDITLTAQIDVDGGGNYIIQGDGSITIDSNACERTFNVTNCQSCTITDLIIKANDISSALISGISIHEENDNPVYIQKVQIIGGGQGQGFDIDSNNIWVQNCYITGFQYGIYLYNSYYCHIIDNSILDTLHTSGGILYGIYFSYSEYNTLTGNIVNNIGNSIDAVGIKLDHSFHNMLTGNILRDIDSTLTGDAFGFMFEFSGYNTLTGNTAHAINSFGGSTEATGIYLIYSTSNALTGNTVRSINQDPPGAVLGYGIHLQDPGNNYNVIVGNTFNYCHDDYILIDSGSNYNNISHNVFV